MSLSVSREAACNRHLGSRSVIEAVKQERVGIVHVCAQPESQSLVQAQVLSITVLAGASANDSELSGHTVQPHYFLGIDENHTGAVHYFNKAAAQQAIAATLAACGVSTVDRGLPGGIRWRRRGHVHGTGETSSRCRLLSKYPQERRLSHRLTD